MKRGIFYAVCASAIYGMILIIAKLAVEVPLVTLVFFQSLICFSFTFFKKKLSWKVNNKKLLFLRIFFGFLNLICLYYAAKYLLLAVDATALSLTGNLFTPFIVLFWDKIKIPKTLIMAVLIGFIGVLVILKPSFNYFNFAGIIGLISGISIGFINVIVRKLSKTDSVHVVISYFFMGNMIISFFPMIYYWKNFENPIMWVYILLLGILAFLFQFFFVRACYSVPVSRISTFFYLSVVFSGFFEWMIYEKKPDLLTIFGILLIIVGGILGYRSKSKAAVPQISGKI